MSGRSVVIKIIPPGGYNVYRLHIHRAVFALVGAALAAVIAGALGVHAWQLHVAENDVRVLRDQTAAQDRRLSEFDKEASALASQLHDVQRENAAIRKLLGVGAPRSTQGSHADHAARPAASADTVAQRLARLSGLSAHVTADGERLRRLTHRVLDMRRLARMARERLLAGVPSLNPVGGAIASHFGWRADPWPEFHRGVDLAADYGTAVHAAADGQVVSTAWDGSFGNKVDLDHGNGYHTWYAHLSRFAVEPGQRIRRGTVIAFVGATGAATGPHLQYQVMRGSEPIDPAPFLDGAPPNAIATLSHVPRVQ